MPTAASAEYFSLYLKCEGEVTSAAGKTGANLDLALRDNNQSALIQRSNILPVGEKMKYEVSPATYSMTYRSPARPHAALLRLVPWTAVRLGSEPEAARLHPAVDRSPDTADLEGDFRNSDDQILARFGMRCQKVDPSVLPAPKF